jgi:hypothetical protein
MGRETVTQPAVNSNSRANRRRSAIRHSIYRGQERPPQDGAPASVGDDPARQHYTPPGGTEDGFTGGGLLGKLMNGGGGSGGPSSRGDGVLPGGRGVETSGEPRRGRRGVMKSSSEGYIGLRRYRHENGPPDHASLALRNSLLPETGRTTDRRHSRRRSGEGSAQETEESENPFDDRQRY